MLSFLRAMLRHPVVFHTNLWGSLYIATAITIYALDPNGFPAPPLVAGGGAIFLSMLGGTATAARLRSGRWSVRRWRFWFFFFCTIPWISGCAIWFAGAPRYLLFALLLAPIGTLMGFRVYRVPITVLFGVLFILLAVLLNFWFGSFELDLIVLLPAAGVFLSYYFLLGLQSANILDREQGRGSLLRQSRRDRRTIHAEREKSDRLLLNILPAEIAEELKETGRTTPRRYESASVLFTDFQGFTLIAAELGPEELISELDRCFSYFDQVCDHYRLEKLKTIGDAYMCAGGIPIANKTHAIDCVLTALEIQDFMNRMKSIKESQGLSYWELRLGIHSGPLVAGVIGERKFAYDVWGDTVNTASRLESTGVTGRVNISGTTFELVREFFQCEYRGKVAAKHKGEVDMYFVLGLLPELSRADEPRVPNERFHTMYDALASGLPGS